MGKYSSFHAPTALCCLWFALCSWLHDHAIVWMNITNGEVSAFAGSETSPSCLGLGMWSWDCTWFCGPAFDLDGTAYVHLLIIHGIILYENCNSLDDCWSWNTGKLWFIWKHRDPFRHGNVIDFRSYATIGTLIPLETWTVFAENGIIGLRMMILEHCLYSTSGQVSTCETYYGMLYVAYQNNHQIWINASFQY